MKEFMRIHYGLDTNVLEKPCMIVVHYTAIGTLAETMFTFKPELLPPKRADIKRGGKVNVSIHFVIAKEGAIYQLQPENIVARHITGLSWCSLGIEMVARYEQDLTQAQLEACARLCAWLAGRHPSIKYLIGHHEYTDSSLPHYSLYRENVPGYRPTIKKDPGAAFMRKLRKKLADEYELVLEK